MFCERQRVPKNNCVAESVAHQAACCVFVVVLWFLKTYLRAGFSVLVTKAWTKAAVRAKAK